MSMCSDTLDLIIEKLFEPSKKILQKHIDTITKLNKDKTHLECNKKFKMFPACCGFTFNNIVYVSSEGTALKSHSHNLEIPYKWNPLDDDLKQRCVELESLYKLVKKNESILPRLFICLLQGAKDFTDIKNRLPDEICELIDLVGERKQQFSVPKNLEPIWFSCKDDIQYLLNLRLLT